MDEEQKPGSAPEGNPSGNDSDPRDDATTPARGLDSELPAQTGSRIPTGLTASGQRAELRADLTEGPLMPHIWRLAIPSMATTALQASYHAIDTWFIAHIPLIGTQALAAMGVFGYFFMLFIVFNQIVGIGSVALIARSFGAKNFEETKIVIGQTFMFKLWIAVFVAIGGLLWTRQFYILFGSTPEVADIGYAYCAIFFLGLPLFFSGFTLNTAFRGIGDMMKPLFISAVAVTLNLFLDWVLIFGNLGAPAMGIRGAALASVIAMAWTLCAGLYIFFSGRTFIRLELRHFLRLSWKWIYRILRIGVPAAVGDNVRELGRFVVGRVINGLGTAIMAAHSVVWPVMALFMMPIWGLEQAVVTMVGQNLGAKKPQRSEKSVYLALASALAISGVIAVAIFIYAPQVVALYTTDPAVVPYALVFVRIAVGALLVMTASMIIGATFWGSGDTKPPMYISIATTWLLNVPAVLILIYALRASVFSIYWAMLATEAVNLLLYFWLFKRGGWKRVRV